MIFTFMWSFDMESNWEYIENLVKRVDELYCIELIASQKVRLERNKTENRLQYKDSKCDIDASNKHILSEDSHHLVSKEVEELIKKHLFYKNNI